MGLRAAERVLLAATVLFFCVGIFAADKVAELQARFDREANAVSKAKLLERLGDAQLEEVHRATGAHDFILAGLIMEKYRDNARAALTSLEKQHPDGERHPGGYKQLQIHLRKAIRDVDETLLEAPEEVQPPFQLVRKELEAMNDEMLARLFPRRGQEKPPMQKPAASEKKP